MKSLLLVVVVVTFFNHNFVNCKATLIWRLKIYEIKYTISLNNVVHSNNEIDKRINVSKIANNIIAQWVMRVLQQANNSSCTACA